MILTPFQPVDSNSAAKDALRQRINRFSLSIADNMSIRLKRDPRIAVAHLTLNHLRCGTAFQ